MLNRSNRSQFQAHRQEVGEPRVFIVEGWGYDGKHRIRRITGLNERKVAHAAYSQHGFAPKEDLYIKADMVAA